MKYEMRSRKRTLKYYRWLRSCLNKKCQAKTISQSQKPPRTILKSQANHFFHQQDIKPIREEQFYHHATKPTSMPLTPIKILLSSNLEFRYPAKVVVRISKSSPNANIDEIDYRFNDESVMYLEINSEEFLSGQKGQSLGQNDKILLQNSNQYSISVPQMTLTKQDYRLPQFVQNYFTQKSKGLYAVNLWHYKKETLTKWHYDAHDNFLFQIKGVKQIFLLSPNSPNSVINSSQLRKAQSYLACDSVFDIDNNHVDESLAILNDVQDPRLQTIVLEENQCLFIPRGWFHKVKSHLNSQGNNIAVNIWGNTIPTYDLPKEQLQINLKQLIYEVSESICQKNVSDWADLNQQFQQKFRKAYFYQYLRRLSPE